MLVRYEIWDTDTCEYSCVNGSDFAEWLFAHNITKVEHHKVDGNNMHTIYRDDNDDIVAWHFIQNIRR